jgi:hypothetical protein
MDVVRTRRKSEQVFPTNEVTFVEVVVSSFDFGQSSMVCMHCMQSQPYYNQNKMRKMLWLKFKMTGYYF